MRVPNTAPISGAEKGWSLLLAVLSFPIGLIVLIGALAGEGWARWVGLVLGVLVGVAGVATAVWLLVVFLPDQAASYPWGAWFVVLSALVALLGLLAARAFLNGLRSAETD